MNRCLKCKTENTPDAEYCIKCGFSLWRDAPAADEALEPPTKIMRVIHLDPEVVRVRRGGHATMAAHLHGEAHPNVEWEIEGSPRAFASLQPTDAGLIIDLRPGFDEPEWASPLEVRCLEAGEVAGLATGTVEVIGDTVVGHQPATAETGALPVDFDPSPATETHEERHRAPPRPDWEEVEPASQPWRHEPARVRQEEQRRPPVDKGRGASEQPTRVFTARARTVPRNPVNTPLIAQLGVLAASGLVLLLVLLAKHYVAYENGWESLFTATKHGGDNSSPMFPADFWTIVAVAIGIVAFAIVSFAGARRTMMTLGAVLGILMLAQLISIAASGHSLREVLHVNPRGHVHAHAVATAFWATVVLAGLVVLAALVGVVAPNADTRGRR